MACVFVKVEQCSDAGHDVPPNFRKLAKVGPRPSATDGRQDTVARVPQGYVLMRSVQARAYPSSDARVRLALPVTLFLIALFIPWVIVIGPARMSAYRLVLTVMFFPCLFAFFSGRCGGVRLADIAVFFSCFWVGLSAWLDAGAGSAIEPAGINFVQTVGAYLLARWLIRSEADFFSVCRLLTLLVLIMLPFALIEFLTGEKAIFQVFRIMLPTYPDDPTQRFGFWRVQGPFDHAILFGLLCGATFPLTYLVTTHGMGPFMRVGLTFAVAFTAALSLSAGPISMLFLLTALLVYDRVLRNLDQRWKILGIGFAFIYVALDLVANRPAYEVIVSFISFESNSYWSRMLIWSYAWKSFLNNFWFGTGLGDWERPEEVYFSIDNFWLAQAVQFGAPAAIGLMVAVGATMVTVMRKAQATAVRSDMKLAYLLVFGGFLFVELSVALWDAAYALHMFFLGCGAFLLENSQTGQASQGKKASRRAHNRRSSPQ